MAAKRLIQKYPICAYFILTFSISWLGALIVVIPKIYSGQTISTLDGLIMFPVMLLGPLTASIILTKVIYGKTGLRILISSMGKWKVPVKWYLLSLFLFPILIYIVLFFLSYYVSSVYKPNLFLLGIAFGLPAGLIEETGWTGFAFPHLLKNHTPFRSSLILGLLWGLWHLPVINFLGAASPHGQYFVPFMIAFIVAMMAVRMIICWVYLNTGSILLAQLCHVISTGSLVFLGPPKVSSLQETIWYFLYALLLWICVSIIFIKKGFVSPRDKIILKKKLTVVHPHPIEEGQPVYCKNCNHLTVEHYCGYCGQSTNTHRINLPFVWHDIQHGFLHFDKGYLFTIKKLFTKPGNSVREYIEGKRVKYAAPISLIIILATICGLLYNEFSAVHTPVQTHTIPKINSITEVGQWVYAHYSLTLLLTLPIASLCSYIIFRKANYNFTEHFVLNAFMASQKLVIRLVTLPFFFYFGILRSVSGESILNIMNLAFYLWTMMTFFKYKAKSRLFFMSLASWFIYQLCLFVLIGLISRIVQ